VTRGACDDEPSTDTQHDGDDDRFVTRVLEGAIPASRCLEGLHADAQRQQHCGEQLADGDRHYLHHSTGLIIEFIVLQRAKQWAREIKRDVVAIWIASRDPRVPWYAKLLAAAVAAYALSPIDLIPDFVPVLGYLDDLVIVPAGILLIVQLIPPDLMDEFRAAATRREGRPHSRVGAAIVVMMWIIGLGAIVGWLRVR
jgi:uncharacterized membrane protein YkvA (DUF1232 family)